MTGDFIRKKIWDKIKSNKKLNNTNTNRRIWFSWKLIRKTKRNIRTARQISTNIDDLEWYKKQSYQLVILIGK